MELHREKDCLSEALNAFDFGGQVAGAVRYGEGHINDTFCVYTQNKAGDGVRFILQRINTNTFPDPDGLMENIVGVTEYLRGIIARLGGYPERETLTVRRTKTGRPYFRDSQGGCWRVFHFVEGTVCLQSVQTPEQFYQSAVAFGNFQRLLSGYDVSTLHETIAQFHDTRARFRAFRKALEADALGRAKQVAPEIQFVLDHEADCSVLMSQLESGALPLRVTHNDTKLNNILLDKTTGKGICIIDLDTVMPGLSLNDFGDSIRFGANHAAEDEPDLRKVNFDLELFACYTKGFLEAAGSVMTPAEIEQLPWGAKLMTLECGIRFLTDYLEGDHYFKIHREGQNLDRCRTQFKLVRDMERNWEKMNAVVRDCCADLALDIKEDASTPM